MRIHLRPVLFVLGIGAWLASSPAEAAITFPLTAGTTTATTGASVTPAIPGSTQAGDLALLVVIGRSSNGTEPAAPTNTPGWVRRGASYRDAGDIMIVIFYKILAGGDVAPTVVLPSGMAGTGGMTAAIAVFRGVDPTSPFDTTEAQDGINNSAAIDPWTTASASPLPSITTVSPGAWVVSAVATPSTTALAMGTANGFTGRMTGGSYDTTTGTDMALGVASKPQPTPGAVTMLTWDQTVASPQVWVGITFALRPAVTYEAIGAVTSTEANNPSCALPAPTGGILANDVGIWHSVSYDANDHVYPAGWTKASLVRQGTAPALVHSWAWKRFAGGETGSQTVTIAHTGTEAAKQCRISVFRGVRTTVDPHEVSALAQGTSTTIDPDPVSVTTKGGSVVTLTAIASANVLGAMSGGSGVGTVTEAYSDEYAAPSGLDTSLIHRRAAPTTTGSVDLGSATITGSARWIAFTIAFGPAEATGPSCAETDVSYVSGSTPPSSTEVTLEFPSAPVMVLRKTSVFTGSDVRSNGTEYPGAFTLAGGPNGTDVIRNSDTAVPSVTDSNGLTAGQKYFYKVLRKNGTCYSSGATAQTEFSIATGQANVDWQYSRSGGTMLNPGIAGYGVVFPSSNAGRRIIAIDTATGADAWTPVTTDGDVQGLVTWVPLKEGTGGCSGSGCEAVIVGDLSGKVYTRRASNGLAPTGWADYGTGKPLQAGLVIQLWEHSNGAFRTNPPYWTDTDVIFAASMDGSTTNRLYAIKVSDGQLAWSFNGTVPCAGCSVSDITTMPYVDYQRNRVYLTTSAATGRSLWVVNGLTGEKVDPCSGCDNLGALASSPTLSYNRATLYVGSTGNPGNLYALDAATLTLKWTFPLADPITPAAGNGSVKAFVWEDYTASPRRLYFTTTTGKVMCVQEKVPDTQTPAPCDNWPAMTNDYLRSVPAAGPPLLLNRLFVGSSDGKVHQISLTNGADEDQVDIDLTPTTVGSLSTETGTEILVGGESGTIYRVTLTGSGLLP
jgi:outer membrane protein assembly factor BamB